MNIWQRILDFWFVTLRVLKYRWLSDCQRVSGSPVRHQPVLLTGKGTITFGKRVEMGVVASPGYYNGYAYIEARLADSAVIFGNHVSVNNNFSVMASGRIVIGDHVLIGMNCAIMDNDGHNLAPDKRRDAVLLSREVRIGENVFLGDNVTILKGVTIGKNAVIGNGSVVTKDIPDNVIAAGNPAVVLRNL